LVSQDHIFKLCLPPELYLGVIKFQAEKEIGRPFAGLLLLTKAAYQEHLISQDVYETLTYRYSRKLVTEDSIQSKKSLGQLQEDQKIKNKNQQFGNVLSQWHLHPDQKWRQAWLEQAEEWKTRCPNARILLEKIEQAIGGKT